MSDTERKLVWVYRKVCTDGAVGIRQATVEVRDSGFGYEKLTSSWGLGRQYSPKEMKASKAEAVKEGLVLIERKIKAAERAIAKLKSIKAEVSKL